MGVTASFGLMMAAVAIKKLTKGKNV